MDLVYSYLPDVFSYQSLRHPNGCDYTWLGSERSQKTERRQQCHGKEPSKESCPICQEQQRRPLSRYIRTKSRQDRKKEASIEEEAEEVAPEQAEEAERRTTGPS